MTEKRVKIRTTEEKSPVEVRQKTAEILDFQRINVFVVSSARGIGRIDVGAS